MKKKKIIIMLILLVFIFIVGISFYVFYNSKSIKVILKKNLNYEINSDIYNVDGISKILNGEIISKKKMINSSKLGKVTINIKLKDYFKNVINYSYFITIIDTVSPVIECEDVISITEGDEIDLLSNVKVTDNSMEDIKASVNGDFDINKVGVYELTYIAKDSSGNEGKKDFKLEVKEKEKIVSNNVNENRTFTTSKGFKAEVIDGITYINGTLIANKSYSLPSSYNPGGLTGEFNDAFNKMASAAASDGLNIYVVSGFRSYNYQNNLYNNYVNQDGRDLADTYSARPGHSEHQTGIAADINMVDSDFEFTDEGRWLNDNAYKYGFILRYPKGKTSETGYIFEPWHYRYVGVDLATKLYNNGDWISLENYFGISSEY